MILRYQRYIARQLTHSLLLIALSLTGIVWLTQALRFLDYIVDQGMSIVAFLKLTLLLIPSLLMLILPPALFAATVFTYHKLKTDSELTVLQAAGLSKWRLAKPALGVALLVTLATYALSLYVMPACYSRFKDMQTFFRNHYASILLQDGVFANPTEGLTVFIRERAANGILKGILVQDSREAGKTITMMAERGEVKQSAGGPQFVLEGGNRQEMRAGKLSFLNFAHYTLDLNLYGASGQPRPAETAELSIASLLAPDPAISQSEARKRASEAHQRLIWPAYALSLSALGLAMLLTGEFNRRGAWKQVARTAAAATLILFGAILLRGAAAQHAYFVPLMYALLGTSLAAGFTRLWEWNWPHARARALPELAA